MATQTVWNSEAATRRASARCEGTEIARTLTEMSPGGHWPSGMPTSVNPMLVIIGASPGASPALDRVEIDYTPTTDAHPGLWYPDTRGYWASVRTLATAVFTRLAPGLSHDDALALTGALNLGTEQAGSAAGSTDPDTAGWAMQAVERLRPVVVLLNGLKGELGQRPDVAAAFNLAGARIDWQRPEEERKFPLGNYSSRIWRRDAHVFIMLPNHLVRHPMKNAGALDVMADEIAAILG